MTGWGEEGDRKLSEQAVFNHHLIKPVDPATLVRLLASMGPHQHAGSTNPS